MRRESRIAPSPPPNFVRSAHSLPVMRGAAPSKRAPWQPPRRLLLAVMALVLHGAAIWLMCRSGLTVRAAGKSDFGAWPGLECKFECPLPTNSAIRTLNPHGAATMPHSARTTGATPEGSSRQ